MEQNQVSFEKALKKGEIGEQIIRSYLEKKGWVVYLPFTKNKAHYFDILATKNKEKVIAIDVKAKARLNKWPAQGINITSYNQYLKFYNDTKIPFYLIFIDEYTGDVHLCEIAKMKESESFYPNKKIIAWFLKDMKHLFKISELDMKLLSQYNQRNYLYNPKC